MIFDFIGKVLTFILGTCVLLFAIFLIICIIEFPFDFYRSMKVSKEWNNKVNACVLDMNSRKDCKLIIYKDKQIHHQHNDNSDMATGMALGTATGMAVGMGMR